jgi:hypothetical protein
MTIRICSECKKQMGKVEDGKVAVSQTDGICPGCMRKNHPGAFAWARERRAMARGAELLAKRNDPLDMMAFARIISADLRSFQVAA